MELLILSWALLEEVALTLGLVALGPRESGTFFRKKVCHVNVKVIDDSTVAVFAEHSDGTETSLEKI